MTLPFPQLRLFRWTPWLAFDVREEMLNAPIAADWVKYNTYDNQGTIKEIYRMINYMCGELIGKSKL